MPNFEWKGIKNSQYVTGTMRALTRDEALFKLKEDGVIITMLSKNIDCHQKNGNHAAFRACDSAIPKNGTRSGG